MTQHTDYNKFFSEAHLNSWPTVGCVVSRDIFDRDKVAIESAAKKNDFVMTANHGSYIRFGQGKYWRGYDLNKRSA